MSDITAGCFGLVSGLTTYAVSLLGQFSWFAKYIDDIPPAKCVPVWA